MTKKLNNESGAILILTLLFVLAFTSLGIASIYFAGQQNEFTEKLKFSTQAFWLADAGVEKAKKITSHPYNSPLFSLGNGTFEFGTKKCSVAQDPQVLSCICDYDINNNPIYCIHRWFIDPPSKGIVKGQARAIQAVFTNIAFNAVTTTDGISGPGNNTPDCEPGGSAEIDGTCQTISGMNLMNYFGINYSNDHAGNITAINTNESPNIDLTALPNYHEYDDVTYDDGASNGIVYEGLVVITNNSNQEIKANALSGTSAAVPAFVIIDCINPDKCFRSVAGEQLNNFYGIIWIIGNAEMAGTPSLHGSLFVQNGGLEGALTGDNLIEYDEDVVFTTLENIGNIKLTETAVVSWKEVPAI